MHWPPPSAAALEPAGRVDVALRNLSAWRDAAALDLAPADLLAETDGPPDQGRTVVDLP